MITSTTTGIKEFLMNIRVILILVLGLVLISALVIILNIPRTVKLILAFNLVITKDLIFISKPDVVVNYLVKLLVSVSERYIER